MHTMLADLRYALRQLRRSPGFALVAVLTLALGIGVTSTVFSVMRQVLLSPLPYPQPERLVGVSLGWPQDPASARQAGEFGEFVMRHSHSYQASTLVNQGSMAANLSSRDGHAASVTLLEVSRGYFDTLGVHPAVGRGFSAEEDLPGGPQAMVLSDGLWQSAFGGDRSIVGRTVRLNQESITVVGVMPKSFRAETYTPTRSLVEPQAWRALQAGPQNAGYCCRNYVMYARLAPGVSFEQAQAELQSLDIGLQHEHPDLKDWTDDEGRKWAPHLRLWPLTTVVSGEVHTSLTVMAWASVAVLLLACLNLAALNTARALAREPESALRAALGASRARLLRLAFFEAGLITASGIAVAVLTSRLLVPFLLLQSPVPIPQLNGAAGLGTTLAQATFAGLVALLLFSAPLAVMALRQGRRNLQPGIKGGRNRAGLALLVLQMGLAVVLLSTASLLLGTFLRLRQQPLGFSPQKLVVFQTNLKGARYGSTAASFGVLLTAIGLFGLLSYQVARRTRELGVRMALGASRGGILRSVIVSSVRLALFGTLLGGAAAWLVRPLLTRWVAENVIGAPPGEHALVFNSGVAVVAAMALLLATTVVAALLPAWRASSVDPMQALRTE